MSADKRYLIRGKPTYGVELGIVLLDATFPRPIGDVANGRSFNFPVHYEVTDGAPVVHVVEDAAAGLLTRFIESGQRLQDRGCSVIGTSCGFLAIFQRELVDALGVPVATSSLLQIPMILRMLPIAKHVGLLTINASTLDARHFAGAGITSEEMARVTVFGLEHSDHFYQVVVGEDGPLDIACATREVVDTCLAALGQQPAIAAFVFECTNLPPYADAVRAATGLPVWDATTLLRWLHGGTQSVP